LTRIHLRLTHPVPQRLPVDPRPAGHPGHRALPLTGLLPDLAHHPHGPLTHLVRILPRRWHDSHLRKARSLQRTRGGSLASPHAPCVPGARPSSSTARPSRNTLSPNSNIVSKSRPTSGCSARRASIGKRPDSIIASIASCDSKYSSLLTPVSCWA